MDYPQPIVGFWQDRSGARLICLLDMIRLSRKFGVPAHYLWLSQPDGPYPELADPGVFFAPELLARHVTVIDAPPDFGQRRALSSLSHVIQSAQFAEGLAKGARFHGGSMIEATRFIDEKPAEVSAELRAIMLDIPLAPRLAKALRTARRKIAKAGRKGAAAIHVRRGDILDGDPWSYRAWPSKYLPDEVFRRYVDLRDGPVIAFSDTPAAVHHLRQGDARIMPVDDLLADQDLSLAERDMLELLLMAECEEIAAPASSAFSMAAALIGGAREMPLPISLAPAERIRAYDELLDRAIHRPDSFLAPGDLAQSLVYAAQHAIAQGRAQEMLDGLNLSEDFQTRFPFVRYWLALAALGAGKRAKAARMASKAIRSDHLRNADRKSVRQILDLARIAKGDEGGAEDASFLTVAFTGGGPLGPVLARQVLLRGGAAAQALMFGPEMVELLSEPAETGMIATIADGQPGDAKVLPHWTYLADWAELIGNPSDRDNLSRHPPLPQKLAVGGELLATVEKKLLNDQLPAVPAAQGLLRLGFCAGKLGLHGRLRRAFVLLHWLDRVQPDNALTHKRLADCSYRAGNRAAGRRWLNSAIRLAPENALLHASACLRALEEPQPGRARRHLDQAMLYWPDLGVLERLNNQVKRAERQRARQSESAAPGS